MANPEQPWAGGEPEDEFVPAEAIRDTIHTVRHAKMLFEMVADLLGERCLIETAEGGRRRFLFVREESGADRIVPWPLVSLRIGGRLSTVALLWAPPGTPEEPPPRPGRVPRLRGLGPGEVIIHDGAQFVTVTYGADGRWVETSKGKEPAELTGAVSAVAKGTGPRVELLANYVASLDVARHGPGRIQLPVPLPGCAGIWQRGLSAIRVALFDDRIPSAARWIVADGWAGTALAWGTTRDEALEAWRADVERNQPRPPRSGQSRPATEDSVERRGEWPDEVTIEMKLSAPPSDIPQPDPLPENTPAVLIPLEPPPRAAPPWGSWTRLLGRFGTTVPAALRREADGFTLVGDRLAESIDLDDLDARLDAVALPPMPPAPAGRDAHRRRAKSLVVIYTFVDPATGVPMTPYASQTSRGPAFDPATLDGDDLRWKVVRGRRLAAD